MRQRYIIGGIALVVIAGLAFAFLRPATAPQAAAPTPVLATAVVRTTPGVNEARVVPVRSATLAFPVAGTIAEILVQEGQTVQAGQAIMRLDQTRAQAALAQAEAERRRAQAAYDQVRAGATPEQVRAAEAAVRVAQAQLQQANGGVTKADVAAAEAQVAQARAALAALQAGASKLDIQAAEATLAQARANLNTQRDQLSAAKTNAEFQLKRATSDLTAAQASYSSAKQNWEYVQETNQDPVQPWLGTDPKSGNKIANTLSEAQRQRYYAAFVQAEAIMRAAEVAIEQAKVTAATTRQAEVSGIQAAEQQVALSQVALAQLRAGASQADLAAARATLARSQAALAQLSGEQRTGTLEAAQAATEQAEATLAALEAGPSTTTLALADADRARAQAAYELAQAVLAETELKAPFAGTIAALSIQAGEIVTPGVSIGQIADLSTWQLETTDVTEQTIVRVREGMPVEVMIDALPDLELTGTVSHIRAPGEAKQGDITYRVIIALAKQDPRLRWNMTATVAFPEP